MAQGQQRLLHGACGGHHDQRGRQAGVLGKIVKPLEGGGEELQVQGRGGVDEVVLLGEIDVLEGVPAGQQHLVGVDAHKGVPAREMIAEPGLPLGLEGSFLQGRPAERRELGQVALFTLGEIPLGQQEQQRRARENGRGKDSRAEPSDPSFHRRTS